METEDHERLLLLADKLDRGGLTTSEQFELARLIRETVAEYKRLLRQSEPHGWGYAH